MKHNSIHEIDFTQPSLLRPRNIIALINLLLIVITLASLLSFAHYFFEKDWKNDKTHWQAVIDSGLIQYTAFTSDYEEEIESSPNLTDEEKTKAIVNFYYLPCKVVKDFQLEISNSHFSSHSETFRAELLTETSQLLILCDDFQEVLPKLVSSVRGKKIGQYSSRYQLNKKTGQVSELFQSVVKKIKNQIKSHRVLSGTWVDRTYLAFVFMILVAIKIILVPFIGFIRKDSQELDMTYEEFEALARYDDADPVVLMRMMIHNKELFNIICEQKSVLDKQKNILWDLVIGILGMVFMGETLHSSYSGYFSMLLTTAFLVVSSLITKKT